MTTTAYSDRSRLERDSMWKTSGGIWLFDFWTMRDRRIGNLERMDGAEFEVRMERGQSE